MIEIVKTLFGWCRRKQRWELSEITSINLREFVNHHNKGELTDEKDVCQKGVSKC